MPVPATLEREVVELRDKIRTTDAEQVAEKAKADKVVEDYRAKGVNPLLDADAFKQVDEAYKVSDGLAEQVAEYRRRLDKTLDRASGEGSNKADSDPGHPDVRKARSLGAKFCASDEYAHLQQSGVLKMRGARVEAGAVEVCDRDEVLARLFKAATLDAGPMVPDDQRLFPPVEFPVRQLVVRDLVTVGETDTDNVEFVEETTRTDPAAETPYGTNAPEATYVYTLRSAPVKRIPEFVPVTKGNLADQAQLRTKIDNNLIYGVGRRLDGQMISGDGAGDNLTGILNTAGIGTQALGADSRSDAFHKGITVVRLALFDEPDAFLLHPSDYQDWVLEKGGDGHYVNHQGPQQGTPPTIWGLRAAINTATAAGTGIVGNWKRGAVLYVRSGIMVAASDSHSDFFIKGLVALLAELRAAFAVEQPKAFCSITGI